MRVLIRCAILSLLFAVMLCASVTTVAADPRLAAAGTTSFTYAKIVGYGDVVDEAGSQFRDGRFDLRALNNNGELGILSSVSDPVRLGRTGLWILSTSTYREVTFEPLNSFLLADSRPTINDSAQGAVRRSIFASNGHTRLRALTQFSVDGQLNDVVRQGDVFGPNNATVVDVSITPSINSVGDIGVGPYCTIPGVRDEYYYGYFADGVFHQLVAQGDPSPVGGTFLLNIGPVPPVWVNANRQLLFLGDVIDDVHGFRPGTFRVTGTTVEKIVIVGDMMPNGATVRLASSPQGTMNSAGDVGFVALLDGTADSGVFVFNDGQLRTVYTEGDQSPLGGQFLSISGYNLAAGPFLTLPIINDRRSVLYKVAANNTKGKPRAGLFLWREGQPAEKVVAVGDRMLDGRRVHQIGYYSLNDNDQVAFSVIYKSKRGRMTESIYLATPV